MRAGLLTERRERTKRLYRLRVEGFDGVRELLSSFWDANLKSLKAAIEEEYTAEKRGR